jgi:hypothetical protein
MGQVEEQGLFTRSKDGYFSFGKVAIAFNDPEPAHMAQWVIGPVQMAPH